MVRQWQSRSDFDPRVDVYLWARGWRRYTDGTRCFWLDGGKLFEFWFRDLRAGHHVQVLQAHGLLYAL